MSMSTILGQIGSLSKTTLGYGYNLNNGLRSFRNALADIDSKSLKIACVGDSVTFGSFCSDIQNKSWASRLRTALQSKLGNAGIGTYPIPVSNYSPSVTPWTMAGTWNYASGGASAFSRFMQPTGGVASTATVTFTGTAFDLIYATNSSGATSTSITLDGGAITSPNFNSGSLTWSNVRSYTGLTSGNHTLVITGPASGNIWIEGLIAYNPPASSPMGCYVLNMGTPSMHADQYSPAASLITNVAKANLYILAFGINDRLDSESTYLSSMGTLISQFQSTGASVLLLAYYPINDATPANIVAYNQRIQDMYTLADQYNCGLIDISKRWDNSWLTNTGYGLMADGTGTFTTAQSTSGNGDYVHPSDKGHREIANSIALQLIGQIS